MRMDRRDFSKYGLLAGMGVLAEGAAEAGSGAGQAGGAEFYEEAAKRLPVRHFDVVVAGAGTAGVVAAVAAARGGAKTAVVELKGYPGGTATEGGTALHSYYNLWKAFPGVEKRQVVRGIAQEIIDRLMEVGGCTGHAEMLERYNYDSVCTAIDTELYKLVTFEMLVEAGVHVFVNTRVAGAIMDGARVRGVIVESRAGREAFYAKSFVDSTAYGDLAAYAGAKYREPNDYDVCNSVGIGNVDVDRYYEFFQANKLSGQLARGMRSGQADQIVRAGADTWSINMPDLAREARAIGMSFITTTVHDNYFMFIKCNLRLRVSPTDRDEVARGELEIRRRMAKAVELFRRYIPGCEKAFMARTSPNLCIRRARCIECDYDITHEDVIEARHFDDEVMVYGFHDMAPGLQIKGGGTYGVPYRALCVAGVENLYAAGMLITSDRRAHMSTRNTVCCMGQGQAAGAAAALCAARGVGSRDLKYGVLRDALGEGGVYFEA